MKRLEKAVRDYLDLRRSLGFKLEKVPGLLSDFLSFLKEQGANYITVTLALQWAQRNPDVQPNAMAWRLTCIRGFARYWSATDPRTQIPPQGLLPYRSRRPQPYLYTDQEIGRLLKAARDLGGLHGLTYYCLFGLLSVTGLRISEVFNLRPQDVDLRQGMLTIVGTKFGKSRLVPIHSSTQAVLARYVRQRDRAFRRELAYFFVSRRGNRLTGAGVHRIFYNLSRQIGLRSPNASHGPRLHDLRHTFAVRTLVRWYRSGQNIEQHLPLLSTYLGHGLVRDTYWYLTACPELMGLAVSRFERHWEERT
jgi:integrase/recombinase XerD